MGGGLLSQFVSEQEYSKLFERDALGISSLTEAFTDGRLRETASQYGTAGNLSYALDAEYLYRYGEEGNDKLRNFEDFGTFKLQLGPQDTTFFQTEVVDLDTGDVAPRYDRRADQTLTVEQEDPITGVTRTYPTNGSGA